MLFLDMTDRARKALVKRTLEPTLPKTQKRRKAIEARVACLEERPEVLAAARIQQVYADKAVADQVCKFTSSFWNPLLNICSRIAQGYAHPPIRRLPGDQEAEAALLEFLEGPTRFDSRAKEWNLASVALNTIVVLVVAKVRRGKPCFEFRVVHGAVAEVVQDPDAPFGDAPAILSYCLHRPEERYQLANENNIPAVCVVDGFAYHYCNKQGTVLKSEPHGLTRFPGAVLRCGEPTGQDDDDWWNYRRNAALVSGTATYGAIGAICEWARHTQFGYLVTVERADEGENGSEMLSEEGQTLGVPEAVFEVMNGKVQVHEFEAKVDGFLKHQAAILHETARKTTGSSRILDDQQLADSELVQRHAVLLQLQRDQHNYLGPFERDIFEVMAEIGEVYGIEGFPKVSQLETLETQFIPLTYVSTPEARLKYFIEAAKFGVTDQVQFLQEQGWSEKDAISHLKRIAYRRADVIDILVERNLPSDPTKPITSEIVTSEPDPALPGERPEAQTGRVGGRAKPTANGE